MGKSTAKGTRNENYMRDTYLRRIWPKAERAAKKGIHDTGDYINTGNWLIEAKWRKRPADWRLSTWVLDLIGKVQKYSPTSPWLLMLSADRRSFPTDLAVIPMEHLISLMEYNRYLESLLERHEIEHP